MEDQETGESTVFDHETGETLYRNAATKSQSVPKTDAETGEPETKSSCKKRHFHVPKTLYTDRPRLVVQKFHSTDRRANAQSVCCIEEKMVSGSQNMSPIVFMLPTLFLFPAWASVLCVFFELCIHMWAHKRNKLHGNDLGFPPYKSPLNIITSEFCAHCRSDRLMNRIGKLQDERKLQIDNRKLRAYMEKVSSIVT